MKFKIRYADQIVGVFSLFALAALFALIFAIGASQNWFVKKNHYYSYFNSGSGLTVGMDVTYKGFAIGKIKNVKLEGSMARVEFYILGEYADYAKEYSFVELITSPIGLGSSFVFYPGVGSELLAPGSEIYRIDSVIAKEIIASRQIRLEGQEDSIGVLMKKISSIMDNVNSLLANINSALSDNDEASTPIKQIVKNVDEITKNLSLFTNSINSEDGAVPSLLGGELSSDVSDVLKNISVVSEELSSIAGSADTIIDTALPEVDQILIKLNSTLVEAQDVLTGVKNNPLIRGGVPDRSKGKSSTSQLRSDDF
ncbi:MCE family protein [Treponema ruminis]|uniref:Phospholipid/cholesterol/gamma-HCH transport system substrate-binding protein n=1 Tax=Treponema ruminis TaxID=744515 RepID=A0A7W8LLR8_9SPIR|nr:MlaD family protein [Treponema ruminis]MBB5225736.1 phospholipid/cholesterol/gamma-HCH transport system substrate-binding protein [Treponema ruminis]QSI02426.1 MCE family protein [Treponema ruminis]